MKFDMQLIGPAALALLTALVVSFLMTPVVKSFAYKVGAIDVPKDERRMHHKPIPRLGGLAIFAGFMASILLFVDIRLNPQMQSILLGAVIIVVLGVVDDIMALPAKLKFVVQIVAALIPALNGVSIQALSNPNLFSANAYWVLNWLSVPITVLWIVGITNAVNLIDGLDGLANGVSAISAATVLVIALICSEAQVAIVMAALVGACVGFLPYNLNPAKMFMGDTGATFLGFVLATMSIQGLFKFYAVISFAVPFLILGLPIFDTAFAMIRRMAHGQSPMQADRGHIHHRLIDMGLNQKQAVATLYVISGILGLSAVVLTTGGEAKAMLLLVALCIVAVAAARVVFPKEVKEELHEELEELEEELDEEYCFLEISVTTPWNVLFGYASTVNSTPCPTATSPISVSSTRSSIRMEERSATLTMTIWLDSPWETVSPSFIGSPMTTPSIGETMTVSLTSACALS